MGKGGGRGEGKGKGKGGCDCLAEGISRIVGFICCILIIGPVLIAIGIGLFVAAAKDFRQKNIDSVQSSINGWASNSSGLLAQSPFSRLNFTATVQPLQLGGVCASYPPTTVQLRPDFSNSDWWFDKTGAYCCGKYPQVRQVATLDSYPSSCGYSVTIKNRDGNLVATISQPVTSGQRGVAVPVNVNRVGPYNCPSTLSSCSNSDADSCRRNCDSVSGSWSCSSGAGYQCIAPAYFNNLCVKVKVDASGRPTADPNDPDSNVGCNTWPSYMSKPNSDDVFRVTNFTLNSAPGMSGRSLANEPLTLTVRSSADPWLKYMAVTNGSGSFGATKGALIAVGIILLVIGGIVCLAWVMACYCAAKMFCCPPQQRPQGYSGTAYDIFQHYGLVQGTPVAYAPGGMGPPPPPGPAGQAYGYPTAQPTNPAYGAPPAGYPAPGGYPPQPQGYPPHEPQQVYAAYPPPPQGYPPQPQGYPPQPQGYPQPQPHAYPPQQGYGAPPQGYPPQQEAYPQPPAGYPGAGPSAGGYPPMGKQ